MGPPKHLQPMSSECLCPVARQIDNPVILGPRIAQDRCQVFRSLLASPLCRFLALLLSWLDRIKLAIVPFLSIEKPKFGKKICPKWNKFQFAGLSQQLGLIFFLKYKRKMVNGTQSGLFLYNLVPNIAEEAKTRALDKIEPALKDKRNNSAIQKRHKLFWVWRKHFLPGIEPRTPKTIFLTLPLG